jgi:hypothetical protein
VKLATLILSLVLSSALFAQTTETTPVDAGTGNAAPAHTTTAPATESVGMPSKENPMKEIKHEKKAKGKKAAKKAAHHAKKAKKKKKHSAQ